MQGKEKKRLIVTDAPDTRDSYGVKGQRVTMQGKEKKRLIKRFFSFPCMVTLLFLIVSDCLPLVNNQKQSCAKKGRSFSKYG